MNGVYKFETVVDDSIIVLMSTVQGSSNPANMVTIMRLDGYVTYQQDPYNTPGVNNTATLSLAKGYYYTEILARGLGDTNYYYVSVSMPPKITPNSASPVANPTWKIENVVMAPISVQPEIMNITVNTIDFKGATSYTLYYFTGSGSSSKRVSSAAIPIKATLA